MEVILNFTDNEVKLIGALLGYTAEIKVVTEIEEEDGSTRVEESIVPNPYTIEQYVDQAVKEYVNTYKTEAIAKQTQIQAKSALAKINTKEAQEYITAQVEARGIEALSEIMKEIL